jgi:tRNA pseudouridine13 synthase
VPKSVSNESGESVVEEEPPLPSARLKIDAGRTLDLIESVTAEEGLERRQLRVKYPRDSFFSKSSRQTMIAVPRLEFSLSDDELYPAKQKVTLEFDLPRGSYATILVKRLTALIES